MSKLLPLFFDLEGKSILLVGAGRVSLEKLEKLLLTDAFIHIVAPEVEPEVLKLVSQWPDRIRLQKRSYESGDAALADLVIVATNNSSINHDIVLDSQSHGKLVNAVDDRKHCDFLFSAQIHYGATQIAVSSDGQLPGLVRAIREVLEEVLPPTDHDLLDNLIALRKQLKQVYPDFSERTRIFTGLLEQWKKAYLGTDKLESLQLTHKNSFQERKPG